MRRNLAFLGVLTVLVAAGATAWWSQRQTAVTLRAELDRRREQDSERRRLAAENERLRAAQVTPAELESLRSDHAAVARLRAEIDAAKTRVQAAVQTARVKAAGQPYEPTMLDGPLPAAQWKNAGAATPAAAIETALWAAAGGDIEALGQMLAFAPGTQAKADALWAELSPATRTRYGSVAQLVAELTAKDVPLGRARLIDPKFRDESGVRFVAQLSKAEEKPRTVALTLRQEGDQWKLVVPPGVIDRYGAMLRAAEAGAVGVK
jgi:hypothetical protein